MSSKLKRDDGTEVDVEFELESEGSPNFDFPGHCCDGGGEPPSWTVAAAYDAAGAEVTLTDAEIDRFAAWACEHLEYDPPEFDDNVL